MMCQQVQKLLPDYSVGNLPPSRQEALARHLETCPTCAQEWAALQGSLALLERLGRAEPPARLWAQIEARLTAERPRTSWRWLQRRLSLRWLGVPALAAAVAAVAAAAVLFLRLAPPKTSLIQPTTPVFAGNSFVQQHATLASYEPLADRAALGVVATLAQREGQARPQKAQRGNGK